MCAFMTIFSILKKMFQKINDLMCALKTHINQTLITIGEYKYIDVRME